MVITKVKFPEILRSQKRKIIDKLTKTKYSFIKLIKKSYQKRIWLFCCGKYMDMLKNDLSIPVIHK